MVVICELTSNVGQYVTNMRLCGFHVRQRSVIHQQEYDSRVLDANATKICRI